MRAAARLGVLLALTVLAAAAAQKQDWDAVLAIVGLIGLVLWRD